MNYGEEICKAASIIAQGVIDSAKLDKTLRVIVVNSEKESEGKYECLYENNTFIAHGTPFTYGKGDEVFVLVPGGNWANKINIIGFAKVVPHDKDNVGVTVAWEKGTGKFAAWGPGGDFIGYISGGGETLEPADNKGF